MRIYPSRHPNKRLTLCALIALGASPAGAQNHPAVEFSNDAQTLTPDKETQAKGKTDLLVVPIPLSNPATGSGLTLAGVLFYNPNDAPQPWVSGIGALHTSGGTKAIAGFHSMSLAQDRFRFLAVAGYADAKLKFYGIGADAGHRDASVDIEDKGALAMVQGQMRLFPHTYAGARFQYLDVTATVKAPHPNFPDLQLPPLEAESSLTMIGPALTYDSRDSSTNPRKGVYATATWMFGTTIFGGDFKHDKLNIQTNLYSPIGPATVIATRGSLCGASTGAPFYDLCMFGMSSDLRGYETGRYRDRAYWAIQSEIRQQLSSRVGAVVFVGIGGIAPKLGSIFGDSTVLPAGGMGLRYKASKSSNINLRLDIAMGKDTQAVYFGIGEAF
jgi:hypothetical protein